MKLMEKKLLFKELTWTHGLKASCRHQYSVLMGVETTVNVYYNDELLNYSTDLDHIPSDFEMANIVEDALRTPDVIHEIKLINYSVLPDNEINTYIKAMMEFKPNDHE
jgi:hypothetical protein